MQHTTVRDVCTRRIGNKIGNFLYRLSVFINGKHFFSCLRKVSLLQKTKLSKSNTLHTVYSFPLLLKSVLFFIFPTIQIRIRCSGL